MIANADAQLARAVELHRLQDLEGAAALYEQVILGDPHNFLAHHALGAIRAGAGQTAKALPLLRRAARLAPGNAEVQANLGAALLELNRFDDAEAAIRRAIDLDAGAVEAYSHLGKLLSRRFRHAEAVAAYRVARDRMPEDAIAQFNLGYALLQAEQPHAAIDCLRRAVQIEPCYATFRTGLAQALAAAGEREAALAEAGRAIALDPGNPDPRQVEYAVLLAAGDWEAGWNKYEDRAIGRAGLFFCDGSGLPRWQGEDLAGKRLLLHAEQGLGDTLQFIRYLPLVKARGPAAIVLAVQPVLRDFLGVDSEADSVIGFDEPHPPVDLHCPIMSLPRLFGTRIDTVPAEPGYLRRHLREQPRIATAIGTVARPRVGLVWSANPLVKSGPGRSIPLPSLAPLLALDAVNFIVLQAEISSEDAACLATLPRITTLAGDIADKAAAIDALDLVVSVDTSMAHLAAGLGVPCWIPLPERADWRWLEQRSDSPWYPCVRLFRQAGGTGWPPVVARLREALERFSAGP